MPELTGKQRKYLRGRAHALGAVVRVGRNGLTDAVCAQTSDALATHELIKVKIEAEREERPAIAEALASACGAAIAGMIGRVAVLYRPHEEPEKRAIVLPD